MSMGRGAIVNVSRRHKLNVGSSTESELVSIADVLGVMIWCKYFMEAQGYTIDNNLLYVEPDTCGVPVSTYATNGYGATGARPNG